MHRPIACDPLGANLRDPSGLCDPHDPWTACVTRDVFGSQVTGYVLISYVDVRRPGAAVPADHPWQDTVQAERPRRGVLPHGHHVQDVQPGDAGTQR